ncbi:MAG: exopolyphosphatase, partial [Sedimentibacter sp.]
MSLLGENIAIIDLGSNSVRIIIIKINSNGSYKMIEQLKEMVRLSEGMWKDNFLREEAMERTIIALKKFKNITRAQNVNKIVAVATAAVRNAVNGNEFLERVIEETGFNIEIISGTEEAYLDYLGVINSIAVNDCIIIDTGGGSTELILVKDRKLQNSISIPYGSVNLSEKYFDEEEISVDNLNKVIDYIKEIYKSLTWLEQETKLTIVGLGGSIRTLAKIHKRKYGLISQPIHNYGIDSNDVNDLFEYVINTKKNERKEIPGLNKERTDIIVGGLIPLKILLDYIKPKKIVVSGNGLREGSFFKYYFKKYMLDGEIVNNVLQHSIDKTLLKYDIDIHHSHLIRKLSLDLFDQLKEIHELEDEYRKLLDVSSLMHDIGLHVDYYNHHYHGFYLTLNSRINGLDYREIVICSFVIGMHRNEDLKQD